MCDALGGSAMKECPAGSYCVAGKAVACPFESTSRAGSDSVDDCVCDAGLSLVANSICESVVLDESSVWTPSVIACVVAGCVSVVGVFWWVVRSCMQPNHIGTPDPDPAAVPLLLLNPKK